MPVLALGTVYLLAGRTAGHVTTVVTALFAAWALGVITTSPVAASVHAYASGDIPRGSEALFVLQHIRDEAHRFAITYHRQKRARRALRSPLDDIPGVGAARKKALLKRFGSLTRMRTAKVDELQSVPGVGPSLARTIHDHLHAAHAGARKAR